jgi:Holliday junction resolvase RusA-like endonuclease
MGQDEEARVTTAHVEFTVFGTPAPKGSTRAFMRPGMKFPVVTHDNLKTKPWQESVVSAAREALMGPLGSPRAAFMGPAALFVRFFLPRPKSAPRSVVEPAKKPDLDKLVRCVKDGLTRAGVYRDDAQVVLTVARKEFAGGACDPDGAHGVPRAWVVVGPVASSVFPWGAPVGQRLF